MPKRKAASEDEQSEDFSEEEAAESSGSEEKSASKKKSKKQSIKKPKFEAKESSSKSTGSTKVLKNAEGDKYIDLGKKKRAVVRQFKGMALLDIREYYGADGEEKPGKKGISLQLEQWQLLRDNISTIDELLAQLKK